MTFYFVRHFIISFQICSFLIVHRNFMNVKNNERSEISLHLQANMFISHSFMDTGQRFWLRGKGQYSTQIIAFARVTSLLSVSWAPVPRATQLGPGGITFSWLHYRRRTLRFRRKKRAAGKTLQPLPHWETLSLLSWTANNSCLFSTEIF